MNIKTIPNCYVAVFDILGFSNLVRNSSHVDLVSFYKGFTENVINSVAKYQFKKETTSSGTTFNQDLSRTLVNSLVISDSVVLWTDNDNVNCFYDILLTSWHMLAFGIFTASPLRGVITHGSISLIDARISSNADNRHSTFFGKTIVEAYQLEKTQDWSGGIITDVCIAQYEKVFNNEMPNSSDPNRFSRALSIIALEKRGYIVKYVVPMKNNTQSSMYAINWPRLYNPKLEERTIRSSFTRNIKELDECSKTKMENTVAFWKLTPEGNRDEESWKRN